MSKKSLLKGILLGLAVGGVAGVLLAPKSGKQTRQDLKKAYKSTSRDIAKKINSIEDLTKSKYDQIVDSVLTEYQKLDPITKEQLESLKTILNNKWNEIMSNKLK
jgi:gas vesicle protein